MSKIYIVNGNNGESYEDHSDWPVKAFVSKRKAEAYRILCLAEIPLITKEGQQSRYDKHVDYWETRHRLITYFITTLDLVK